jgi:hypothetical protein
MMKGGNVMQLDADDDAMWGIEANGGQIIWRPSGDVGKHSRWERVEGPPSPVRLLAVDNTPEIPGTWLWCVDDDEKLWRGFRAQRCTSRFSQSEPADNTMGWTQVDEYGIPFVPVLAAAVDRTLVCLPAGVSTRTPLSCQRSTILAFAL